MNAPGVSGAGNGRTSSVWAIATDSRTRGTVSKSSPSRSAPTASCAASGAGPWYFDQAADQLSRGELAIWETGTGGEILFERGIAGRVFGVAFSPDGRFVAAVSGQRAPVPEGRLTLHDASTGRARWSRIVKDTNLICVAFSPDSSTVATGCGFVNHAGTGANEACKLWVAESGTEIATLPGRPGGVCGLCFRPDGKAIVLCHNGVVELWDIARKSVIREFTGLTEFVRSPEFTNESAILTACDSRSVAFWNVATGRLIRRLSLVDGHSIDVAPDGRTFVSTGFDNSSVHLRDIESGAVIASFCGHDGPVYQAVFSQDGRQLLTASADRTVRAWDVSGGRFDNPDVDFNGGGVRWVQGVAISPDGTRVVTAARDDTVRIWDAVGGLPLQTFRGSSGARKWNDVFWCLAMSPDGRQIVAGHGDGTVRRWDLLLGKELAPLRGHTDRVHSVAFSPDGKRIASGSADHTIRIWDAETGRLLVGIIGHGRFVMALAFSADGSRLVSGGGGLEWSRSSANGEVGCWDTVKGTEVFARPTTGSSIFAVAFSTDSHQIAAAGDDGEVRLLDAADGRTLRMQSLHAGQVLALQFNPDGSRLALSCTNGVRIWESSSWKSCSAFAVRSFAASRSTGPATSLSAATIAVCPCSSTAPRWQATRPACPNDAQKSSRPSTMRSLAKQSGDGTSTEVTRSPLSALRTTIHYFMTRTVLANSPKNWCGSIRETRRLSRSSERSISRQAGLATPSLPSTAPRVRGPATLRFIATS